MELDPLQRSGAGGGVLGVRSLARIDGTAGWSQMPGAQRREAALSLQRSRGNRFVQGMAVQAKLMVGPADDEGLRGKRIGLLSR